MALPQMGAVVASFGSPAELRETVQTIVDHRPVTTYVDSDITPTVQPAQHQDLDIESIDYSKQYLMVHSTVKLKIGDHILWQGTVFKIVALGDYNLYGFYESTAEELKT